MDYITSQMCNASDRERELYFHQCMNLGNQLQLNQKMIEQTEYMMFLIKQIETQDKLIKKQEEQIRFLSQYIENGGMKYE